VAGSCVWSTGEPQHTWRCVDIDHHTTGTHSHDRASPPTHYDTCCSRLPTLSTCTPSLHTPPSYTHALTFKHGVDATHRCSLLKPRNKQLEGLFTAQEINSTVLHSNYVSCFTARLLCRPIAVMSSTESATNGLALLVNDCHYDEQPLWFGTRVPN